MPDEGSQSIRRDMADSMKGQTAEVGRQMSQSVGGYELVLSGVLFALAGVWIDSKLGTTPIFIIVFSVLGFGGSVANIYYRYRREMAAHEAEAAERKKAQR